MVKVFNFSLKRLMSIAVLFFLLLAGYMLINRYQTSGVDLSTPLDLWIPFVPGTLFIYLSFWIFMPVSLLTLSDQDFKEMTRGLIRINLISWAAFLLLPASYPRALYQRLLTDGFFDKALLKMWTLEGAFNNLPSLHVATTVFIYLGLPQNLKKNGIGVWALLIIASTLFVKQHFVVDLVFGGLLGLYAHLVYFPKVEPIGVGKKLGQLNVGLAILLVLCLLGLNMMSSRFHHPSSQIVIGLLYMLLFFPVYSLIHEAEHSVFHPVRWINESFGFLLSCFFPSSYTLLKSCHIGHHTRNRSEVEQFELVLEGESSIQKRFMFYFTYLGGFWFVIVVSNVLFMLNPRLIINPVVFRHAGMKAMADGISPSVYNRIRLETLMVICFHFAMFKVFGLTWFFLTFLGGFHWSAQQYIPHAFSSCDVLSGAHNVILPRWFEVICLHFNWHLAHHQLPKTSWLDLPFYHDQTKERPRYVPSFLRFWKGPIPINEFTLPGSPSNG